MATAAQEKEKREPVKKKTTNSTSNKVSEKAYLMFHFPMKEDEFKVDYNHLWSHNYRINYWARTESKEGTVTNTICRSHFVQLKQDEDGQWSYKIFED